MTNSISSFIGEEIKPITVRVRHFGNEDQLQVYDNMRMDYFFSLLSSKIKKDFAGLSVKVIEETIIRRIDRRVMNIDNPTIFNTLKDLKIVDNSALLVEEKTEEELNEADDVV